MGSVSKAFQILQIVTAANSDGLTFARIVEQSGIPKASAHRLLRELLELSALSFDEPSRQYRGGLLLARLGSAVMSDYDLRRTARPFLQQLHDETGHVATLGMCDGENGVYLDKIEAKDFGIRMHSEVGKSFPLHCTAMGKVLLSHLDPSQTKRIISRKLKAHTRNSITQAAKLREELVRVRDQGYAIDQEEITRGLVCVAAPVYGADSAVAGAMSCTLPIFLQEERGIDKEIAAVTRIARAASAMSAV